VRARISSTTFVAAAMLGAQALVAAESIFSGPPHADTSDAIQDVISRAQASDRLPSPLDDTPLGRGCALRVENPLAVEVVGDEYRAALSGAVTLPVLSAAVSLRDPAQFHMTIPLCFEAIDYEGYLHILLLSEHALAAEAVDWRVSDYARLAPRALLDIVFNQQNSVELPVNRCGITSPIGSTSLTYGQRQPGFLPGEPYIVRAGIAGGNLTMSLGATTAAAAYYQPAFRVRTAGKELDAATFGAGRYRLVVMTRRNKAFVLARVGTLAIEGGEILTETDGGPLELARAAFARDDPAAASDAYARAALPPLPADPANAPEAALWDAAAAQAAAYLAGRDHDPSLLEGALARWPDCRPLLRIKLHRLVRAQAWSELRALGEARIAEPPRGYMAKLLKGYLSTLDALRISPAQSR
jgi:hypothetical protein